MFSATARETLAQPMYGRAKFDLLRQRRLRVA
jgi:hypothetical protein